MSEYRDAFGNPIPEWAIWAHFERVEVTTPIDRERKYLPGDLIGTTRWEMRQFMRKVHSTPDA